jgi:hypothetical protein
MMRKVGNRSLKSKPKIEAYSSSQLVTTRVPGHHRPHDAKQLKCQSLHCGIAVRRELILLAHGRFITFHAAAKQRAQRSRRRRITLRKGPNHAWFRSNRRPGPLERLKQRQSPATFPEKARRRRNLAEGLSVSQSSAALQRAKPEMPTFYTENDFSLVRLHHRSAGTISISVTSRE